MTLDWLRAHVVRFAHAVTRSGKQEPLQQGYLAGRMFRKPILLRTPGDPTQVT